MKEREECGRITGSKRKKKNQIPHLIPFFFFFFFLTHRCELKEVFCSTIPSKSWDFWDDFLVRTYAPTLVMLYYCLRICVSRISEEEGGDMRGEKESSER